MFPRRDSTLAVAVGALAAAATDRSLRARSQRTLLSGALLVVAALAYPLADKGLGAEPEVLARELGAIGATLAACAVASAVSPRAGRAVVATGWVLHAAFDRLHRRGNDSRLPAWYPALCAGYDFAMAAQLRRP